MCLKKINQFESLLELVIYFSDEKKCLKYLEEWRWKGTIRCPECGNDKIYKFSDGKRFKCSNCLTHFTSKVGTVFGSSKLPMQKWYAAMYLVGCHKKGISSYQLAKDISVSQRTAWFMLHRIRETFKQDMTPFDGITFSDETFIGGKNKNRHSDKKTKYVKGNKGREFKDKTAIIGLMSFDRKLKTVVIPDTTLESIQPVVFSLVKEGSVLVTDDHVSYKAMNNRYVHEVVEHDKRNFLSPNGLSTNPVENVWNMMKKTVIGNYHNVSRKHLQRYADEVTFRHNNKELSEGDKVNLMMSKIENRLTYKKLVSYGKAEGYYNKGCSQNR